MNLIQTLPPWTETPSWIFPFMSEGRRENWLSMEWYSELPKKNFYSPRIMLCKTLLSIHFGLLFSCFVFPPEEITIQDKNIYITLLFLICSECFPSLPSDCKKKVLHLFTLTWVFSESHLLQTSPSASQLNVHESTPCRTSLG